MFSSTTQCEFFAVGPRFCYTKLAISISYIASEMIHHPTIAYHKNSTRRRRTLPLPSLLTTKRKARHPNGHFRIV